MSDPIFCDDIPGIHCCDSCHDDEAEGYDNLWWEEWLHCCCDGLRRLGAAGVKSRDETAVRAWIESHA